MRGEVSDLVLILGTSYSILVVVVLVLVGAAGLCRGEDDVFTGSLDPTGFSPAVHYTSKRETTHTHIKNTMIKLKRFKFTNPKLGCNHIFDITIIF